LEKSIPDPVGIGDQLEIGARSVGLDHERTGAATLVQVVHPGSVVILVKECWLHRIGDRIGESLEEIGGWVGQPNDERMRIDHFQALTRSDKVRFRENENS
jgi:hypothetical protein